MQVCDASFILFLSSSFPFFSFFPSLILLGFTSVCRFPLKFAVLSFIYLVFDSLLDFFCLASVVEDDFVVFQSGHAMLTRYSCSFLMFYIQSMN